ncbi:hypothetical protein ACNKHU_22790 [Shigella flexneri]
MSIGLSGFGFCSHHIGGFETPLRGTFRTLVRVWFALQLIAVYTVANLIVCRGPTMMSPVMLCALHATEMPHDAVSVRVKLRVRTRVRR